MAIPALKQVIKEIQESLDSAGRHMYTGLPPSMKKQGRRIQKMREEFKQLDIDAAKKANAEVKNTKMNRDLPYDIKGKKGKARQDAADGAGDQYFRDHVADGVLDNARKALKDLKGKGELEERVRNAGKELVRGLDSPKVKLQLMRTYMLALQGELSDMSKGVLVDSAAAALYDVYLEGTPAEDAVPFDSDDDNVLTFKDIVEKGADMPSKAKDAASPIDGHAF